MVPLFKCNFQLFESEVESVFIDFMGKLPMGEVEAKSRRTLEDYSARSEYSSGEFWFCTGSFNAFF